MQVFCINRNIVECKDVSGKSCLMLLSRINRNIVECKERIRYLKRGYGNVLIETLWNVKLDISFEVFFQVVRINRNIVECKGSTRSIRKRS